MNMAEFTMTLNEISEDNPHETFGLESYPIFDEKYRVQLNQKILDHFWNREIGQETVSMFRLAMRRHMNEVMPFFNKMYKSELLVIDPLMTVNIENLVESTAKSGSDSTETSTGKTGTTAKARSVASDTPNSMLDEDADYASSANDSVSGSTVDQEGGGTSKTDSETEGKTSNTTKGYSGNQSELLMTYRETLLNIDLDVINSIHNNKLFMMVWGTGEEQFRRQNYYGFNTIYPRIW